jgi:gas vesicle protein
MDIKHWVFDVLPHRRRASTWALPALGGLAVGLAAGIGIGILYAPQTGEEARLKLREGAYRVKDRAAELAARAKDRIGATADRTEARLGAS